MHTKNQRSVLLITPPFTQLNTPYPATMYLKGYLNTLNISSFQLDLSLETFLKLFCSHSLQAIFQCFTESSVWNNDLSAEIFRNKYYYCSKIDVVIQFLQGKNPTLAHSIVKRNFLPEGPRFDNLDDLSWAFGEMGIQDMAKHLATLFLEDIGDFIKNEVDEDFGFSRYAERISRTATDFSPLHEALNTKDTAVTRILKELVQQYIEEVNPEFVCITAPFPGNVFSAFFIAKTIKKHFPNIVCILGGGYVNTELRSVYDERVFQYFDYLTLDDGETPLRKILEFHHTGKLKPEFKRTFLASKGGVSFENNTADFDVAQRDVGTPDYSDLKLGQYISVLEVLNPMHRKWSDGRWNKLTLAHGCYWGKCSFCDVSLDYIARYEPIDAKILCDRIEQIIHQTGSTGFHFVDEAAPPALMRDLAIEILRRGLQISWWTNIRFEKSFTLDLCKLLAASGCIAVTGGLEVASDRLLEKMKKGVTVRQVANVASNFTQSNILVHAYLMYGFPTQTAQETMDSMEVVRQMLEVGIIQSGFWHQFAMTAHSPVGLDPQSYEVVKVGPEFLGFADNDLFHEDPKGADHEMFSEGLRISLHNYMSGVGFDLPLQEWFDFNVPKTKIPKNFIRGAIKNIYDEPKPHQLMIWLGGEIMIEQTQNNQQNGHTDVVVYTLQQPVQFSASFADISRLKAYLPVITPSDAQFSLTKVQTFKEFWESEMMETSYEELITSYLLYNLRLCGLVFV
jgi:hypothetical protein